MKPLNADNQSCDPISSNCVIWQGPDIACIKLCKGDTISDVTYKLATELCTLLASLEVSGFDISCFNLTTCAPEDFHALIQLLIKRICQLEQCTGCIPDCNGNSTLPAPAPGPASGCPDCTVALASCFNYVNQFGDTVTSMQLADYVIAIGNKLCDVIRLNNLTDTTVQTLVVQVKSLQDAPPPVYIPPTVTPTCVLPPVPTEMDVLLAALEAQFCQLRGATGTPDQLYQNISKQCAGLNNEKMLNGSGGTMASIPGWASTVNTLAQAFGNMWLTVCDMRQAVKTIQLNCCPTGCDGVSLNLLAILNDAGTIVNVFLTGTIPTGFVQCSGITVVTIKDSAGGTTTFNMDIIANLNNPSGFPINISATPVNGTLDLTVSMETCLTNTSTGATCQNCLEFVIVNSAQCPALAFVTNETSIDYSFSSNAGSYTYNVQLWDNTGTILLLNNVHVINGAQLVNGSFLAIAPGTNYKIRVTVTSTACPSCDANVCPFVAVATNPLPCEPPDEVVATIILT